MKQTDSLYRVLPDQNILLAVPSPTSPATLEYSGRAGWASEVKKLISQSEFTCNQNVILIIKHGKLHTRAAEIRGRFRRQECRGRPAGCPNVFSSLCQFPTSAKRHETFCFNLKAGKELRNFLSSPLTLLDCIYNIHLYFKIDICPGLP